MRASNVACTAVPLIAVACAALLHAQGSPGERLFADRCASCHSGTPMTNNATVAVGTGMALQVPSLRGLAFRGPFMHDGCANTLADRFNRTTACGGGEAHGHTAGLAETEVADLVAYLETL